MWVELNNIISNQKIQCNVEIEPNFLITLDIHYYKPYIYYMHITFKLT